MGLRRRILVAQLWTLALVCAGIVGGLVAGNLIWRSSHDQVRRLEREIQTMDLLTIRLRQALPSLSAYQDDGHGPHLQSHLKHDAAAMQALLLQLRRHDSEGSGPSPGPELSQAIAQLQQQSEALVEELEARRGRLLLQPEDPALWQAVQRDVIASPSLKALRIQEKQLAALRQGRSATLSEARELEERGEMMELAIPLLGTLVAATLGLGLAWRTSHAMLRPLRRLNSRMQDLQARGDLDAEPLPQEEDLPEEIQALTDNFNGLVQRLRDVLAQLEVLSLTDPLTQVGNRRRFDHALSAEVARHRRQGKELALLLLDLDHFKPFNDLYGHPQGDRCLTRLAEALNALFRRPGELVCRIGGEEFAVLLPETCSHQALGQAQRILQAVEDLAIEHRANPPLTRVSVSVGVSCGRPGDALTGAHLVDAADRALYECKRELGRNSVALAEPITTAVQAMPSPSALDSAIASGDS